MYLRRYIQIRVYSCIYVPQCYNTTRPFRIPCDYFNKHFQRKPQTHIIIKLKNNKYQKIMSCYFQILFNEYFNLEN